MALQFVTKNSLARIDETLTPPGWVSVDGTKTANLDLPYDIGFLGLIVYGLIQMFWTKEEKFVEEHHHHHHHNNKPRKKAPRKKNA